MRKFSIFKMLNRCISILLIFTLLSSLIGCSKSSSLAGEYIGTANSYLQLNEDGTCIYAEDDSTGTGTGNWYMEDDIIYIEVSSLGITAFGDASNANEGILLESNASSWIDEYFRKS